MPQHGHIFRALIASPADCAQERKIIPEVITAWNAVHSLESAAIIEPVLWETHSRPAFGDRPQAIINKQIIDRCDMLIGAFWTRLGTPTGKAESGTAEEIEQFRAVGKQVLLYFSSAPVVPDSLDAEQYRALIEYRDRLGAEGLYSRYDSLAEFRDQIQRHIAATMIELLRESVAPISGAIPEPDPEAEQRVALRAFANDLENFARRFRVEWSAERDSTPVNIDEARFLLSRASDELVHFRSMITNDNSGVAETLDELLKNVRTLQRHQLYLDGGASRRAFWEEGTRILEVLDSVSKRVREVCEERGQSGEA